MSQWDFIMGKRQRLCHYYVVTHIQSTGKHQDLEQRVIFREFLRRLTDNEVYFSIHSFIIHLFTVWYICTPVACDSRYTLSTVRKLTLSNCRSLSRIIDRHQNFSTIFHHFEKCSLHNIASFMSFDCTVDYGMMMAYVFRFY